MWTEWRAVTLPTAADINRAVDSDAVPGQWTGRGYKVPKAAHTEREGMPSRRQLTGGGAFVTMMLSAHASPVHAAPAIPRIIAVQTPKKFYVVPHHSKMIGRLAVAAYSVSQQRASAWIIASCTPWGASVTVSRSGHTVAFTRLRNSASSASGTLLRKGRMALPSDAAARTCGFSVSVPMSLRVPSPQRTDTHGMRDRPRFLVHAEWAE